MTVRSSCVADGQVSAANTWTTVYTVPAGYRLVLRSWTAYMSGATPGTVVFAIAPGATRRQIRSTALAAGGSDPHEVWRVAEAGATLQMYSTVAAALDYYISGALLQL